MCVKLMEGTFTATCLRGVCALPLFTAAAWLPWVLPPAPSGFGFCWPLSTGLSVSTGSLGLAGFSGSGVGVG